MVQLINAFRTEDRILQKPLSELHFYNHDNVQCNFTRNVQLSSGIVCVRIKFFQHDTRFEVVRQM